MNFTMTIKIAWKNIISNRLRSGLTILGLVIGIASVIILVGIGNGAFKSLLLKNIVVCCKDYKNGKAYIGGFA